MNDTKNAIGRKRKKNGFTQIANSLIEDYQLSWKAKGILIYLLSRPDNWKINKTDIQKKATDGRDALQNGLNELKNLGYLHIIRKATENGQFEYIWEYDDVPFTLDEETENQQETGENMQETRKRESRIRETRQRETRLYNNTVFNNTVFNNTKDKEIINNRAFSPAPIMPDQEYNEIVPASKKPSSPEIEREFEQLWKLYPRKLGKKKAFDSYKKARKVKKIPYETIENGLYRYIRYIEQQELTEQYIQHGSTWFNGEKWLDEYVTTGINKKPKNALEYFRMKHGGESHEPNRNGEIIDSYSEVLPELF